MLNTKTLFSRSHHVIMWFVMLSFCFDFIDKIEIFHNINFIKFNKYLKLGFILYALFFIIMYLKTVFKTRKLVIYSILVLSIIFLLKFNFSTRYLFEFLRYIFILITSPLLYYVYIDKKHNLLNNLYFIFKGFIIVNALAILASLLFDITVFHSYRWNRFGHNGFILSQGVTPYIYLTATVLFWVAKNKVMLITTVVIALLSGIKGVYFAELMLISLLFIYSKDFKKGAKIKGLIVSFLTFTASVFWLFKSSVFEKAFKSRGVISTLFSKRTDNTIDLINSITIDNYNFLIGTIKLTRVRLELQILDVLLFFGVLGLLIYVLLFWFLLKTQINTVVSKVFFITCVSLSILSGNLLYIPFASILMLLVLFALNKQSEIR